MPAGLMQKSSEVPVQIRSKISKTMAEDIDLMFYCRIRKGFPIESIISSKPFIQILV